MARLLVLSFTISLDEYGAGPSQSPENPLGVGGEDLHDWLVNTRTFKRMQGREGGDTGIDEDFAARGFGCESSALRHCQNLGPTALVMP